jgi:hypothetical protein
MTKNTIQTTSSPTLHGKYFVLTSTNNLNFVGLVGCLIKLHAVVGDLIYAEVFSTKTAPYKKIFDKNADIHLLEASSDVLNFFGIRVDNQSTVSQPKPVEKKTLNMNKPVSEMNREELDEFDRISAQALLSTLFPELPPSFFVKKNV